MKSFLITSACVMLVVTGLLLSGCHKGQNIPPCAPSCQITKVIGDLESTEEDSFVIAYNNKGNPVSMIRSQTATSRPNFIFRYNHKGQMTDFIGIYADPSYTGEIVFDTWHRYHLDTKGRVILDSTYEFGRIGPGYKPEPLEGRPYLGVRNISTYTYDNQNRIIKSTDTYGFDVIHSTRLYTYNHAGNLEKIVEGTNTYTFSYDNKINYHALNSNWQFLDRDYSVNNPRPVDGYAYNNYGLPISINLAGHNSRSFATQSFSHLLIKYSCK
ncbi:hypothetical protein SAMN05518672_10472 [Chitinophaga sp. CF118]|uniref:hypothetical protein n=1 Tax=Chitinophaga sp. CF118 TaxID=1884367 RepID=UPI0008ED4A49|nr:hypothetical protein [Chitinophaga sp. CF118]SFD99292.1 hypothetical protein SAMN05518672_10472 [Chitinophaga sp. CF118]